MFQYSKTLLDFFYILKEKSYYLNNKYAIIMPQWTLAISYLPPTYLPIPLNARNGEKYTSCIKTSRAFPFSPGHSTMRRWPGKKKSSSANEKYFAGRVRCGETMQPVVSASAPRLKGAFKHCAPRIRIIYMPSWKDNKRSYWPILRGRFPISSEWEIGLDEMSFVFYKLEQRLEEKFPW